MNNTSGTRLHAAAHTSETANGTRMAWLMPRLLLALLLALVNAQGQTEVLSRPADVPAHVDLDRYPFAPVPIETITAGQQVVTRDPATGETGINPVAQAFQRTAYELVHLDLADADGAVVATLRGTTDHPIFTPTGLLPLGQLRPGMAVSTRDTEAGLVVHAVRWEMHPEGVPVWNFEAAGDHTYFVGVAEGGTLVHNAPCPKDLLRAEARDLWQQATGRRAIWDGLDVHHRIPLEYSHLMPGNPNRLSNLLTPPERFHINPARRKKDMTRSA